MAKKPWKQHALMVKKPIAARPDGQEAHGSTP